MNQSNFYTEKKTVNTRIALEEGSYEEQNYEVNTNFMVYFKDKTQYSYIKIENDFKWRRTRITIFWYIWWK